jgi:hypothetical protein
MQCHGRNKVFTAVGDTSYRESYCYRYPAQLMQTYRATLSSATEEISIHCYLDISKVGSVQILGWHRIPHAFQSWCGELRLVCFPSASGCSIVTWHDSFETYGANNLLIGNYVVRRHVCSGSVASDTVLFGSPEAYESNYCPVTKLIRF